MEHNCIKAQLEMGEKKVNLDLESFESIDFNNFDLLFPLSSLSPSATIEMHADANLKPTHENLQLSSLSSESDQTNGSGMADTKTNDRGNSSREKATKHRHKHNVTGSRVTKKAFTIEKLAELAATDPKKAKRIVSNRKAAAKSKEKRERQVTEVEKKVESLLIQKNNLDRELEMLENENQDLEAENNILKIKLETKRQEAKTKQAFIEVFKEQKNTLKILIERNDALFGNNPSSGGLVSQYSSELAPQQFPNIQPQLQEAPNIQPQLQEAPHQPQLCVPPPPPPPPSSSPASPPFGEPFSEHFFGWIF